MPKGVDGEVGSLGGVDGPADDAALNTSMTTQQ